MSQWQADVLNAAVAVFASWLAVRAWRGKVEA